MARKKKILIVEDNAASRKLLAVFLGRAGYEIVEAATGLEGIDQLYAAHPDLIIMDLELPGISGAEVTERLRADASTRHIPVLVSTFLDRESALVKRAITAGVSKILYKPTPLKVFEAEVLRYLSPDA